MPITFPTHPAAVLPLKLWRPGWFDGVALALGSAAPDVAYALDGSGLPVWPLSHQVRGLVLWCLPVTLLGCLLVRRAVPVVAAHLPGGDRLALRDYGALRSSAHPWWITVLSALIGAASHLALDGLEKLMPAVELPGHAVGAVTMTVLLLVIGRRRLIRRWHGAPPVRERRPLLFWSVAAAVALPVLTVTPLLPGAGLLHTTGVRILSATALGLLLGAAAVGALHPEPARTS
ncbi:hypothetical protein ACWT_3666 [Actinoplanes sp. SE50]|uniref:DUF4184 family protein n=1 Tax=unclassified Actinoplanes TaxID=2626549 RepID=UPI00023EC62D|nr:MULTISPECIES: DUF4184 family protein [unclassified Actinoplanes]AEV84689.1 hypothetical protein ACPL_3794 [Actinoplanes sp. SE50/110]ATO83081.1 hypothetical protein ACWT_3666 [Actinoplanes sp. SE50]SLM00488.1 hypothetical protein ACSP50_3721 [Actinoplanes sp. SE50/110]